MTQAGCRRRAFSLLELLLAVGLSIALVALLAMAMDLHLVRLDASRTTIAQAQLARALLDRLAADLRATTTAPAQDVSELQKSAEAAGQFDIDEVDQDPTATDSETAEAAVAAEAEPTPGLNGLLDSLTLDTRQCWQSLTTVEPGAVPQTRVGAGWSQVVYGMSLDPGAPGLVRTETPRDVVRWRVEQGQAAPVVSPIAAEVTAIEFRYFDGTQLLELWEMAEAKRLPTAVEVRLEVVPADELNARFSNAERKAPKVYRRLIRLPAAEDEAPPVDAETAESTGSTGSTGASGGSGAGGSGTGGSGAGGQGGGER